MRLHHQAAIAALFLSVACGGGDSGPSGPNNNPTTGSVQGSVQDQTGAAVPGASVALQATGQTTRNTTTGSSGAYTFANVAAGAWTVAVTPPSGYSLGTNGGISAVTVVAGQQVGVPAIVVTKQATGGPAPASVEVSMANRAFSPQQVEVRIGGTVRFRNNDGEVHNATGSNFQTGNLNPNQASTALTMNNAGTFPYSCTLHAGMNGTITVR
jgi:plastocyanin